MLIKAKEILEIAKEKLWHFRCGVCGKWWSIGDADPEKKEWFCPWCGVKQIVKLKHGRD